MPTIFRAKGYRFFFFSRDGIEPVHIHIAKDNKYGKYWINPIRLAKNYGFTSKELNEIKKLITEKKNLIQEKWDEYFAE
jgi:hypothetical protein